MQRTSRTTTRTRGGFTLMETALATVIIGVGVLAIIEAQQAFLRTNSWSTHASTATYLANEVREMTRTFPRHDRFAGGLYFTTPGDPATLNGWGPESDETSILDFDDLDDFDGLVIGDATTLPDGFTLNTRIPGPIDAFGDVIPETLWSGETEMIEVDGEEQMVAMRGWTQLVSVEKVDPLDYNAVVTDAAFQTDAEGDIIRDVDRYPVRVTVTILYQGEFDQEAPPITTVSWIVPP